MNEYLRIRLRQGYGATGEASAPGMNTRASRPRSGQGAKCGLPKAGDLVAFERGQHAEHHDYDLAFTEKSVNADASD